MKRFIFVLSLVFFSSCLSEDLAEVEEIITENPGETGKVDFCEFDLADVSGDFSLFTTWEFVGFQHVNTKKFDQLTCMARVADLSQKEEALEDMQKITLNFSEDLKSDACGQALTFQVESISSRFSGCYQDGFDGISLYILEESIEYLAGSSVLPVSSFNQHLINSLNNTKVYHIESNKLYLYGNTANERLVFLALDQD